MASVRETGEESLPDTHTELLCLTQMFLLDFNFLFMYIYIIFITVNICIDAQ